MFQDEEQKVELPAIEQLQSLGWEYIHGSLLSPETSSEREYLKDVVLATRLTNAVKRINPWINDANLRAVVRELTHLKVATLMEANQSAWETLVSYQSVIQDLFNTRTTRVHAQPSSRRSDPIDRNRNTSSNRGRAGSSER